jgi:hypothetical protein
MASMGHFYEGDPAARAVVGSVAAELDRLEAYLLDLQTSLLPQHATDDNGLLSLWEAKVGIQVAPVGQTIEARQEKVVAFRRRRVRRGADWRDVVTTVLGTSDWSVEVVPGKRVIITVPFPAASYTSGVLLALLRRVTPAELAVVGLFGAGFTIGESLIGNEFL